MAAHATFTIDANGRVIVSTPPDKDPPPDLGNMRPSNFDDSDMVVNLKLLTATVSR
jgi:hypothetical protein